MPYTLDKDISSMAVDPGAGFFTTDVGVGSVESATQIAVDWVDNLAVSRAGTLLNGTRYPPGFLLITSTVTPDNWILFRYWTQATGAGAPNTYEVYSVTWVNGSTSDFSDGDSVTITFFPIDQPWVYPNEYVTSNNAGASETKLISHGVPGGSVQVIIEEFYEITSGIVVELDVGCFLYIQSTTSSQGIFTSGTDAWGAWLELV